MKIIKTESFNKIANQKNIIKESQVSITDVLLRLFPNNTLVNLINSPNSEAVKILYKIWKDEKNCINGNTYKRPMNISSEDIEKMKKAKLIDNIGDKIKITTTGSEALKKVILSDDSSALENKNLKK